MRVVLYHISDLHIIYQSKTNAQRIKSSKKKVTDEDFLKRKLV